MAVGTFQLYSTGKEALTADNANNINWASDTIVAVLLGTGYTPAITHSVYSDISTNIIADVGYAPAVVSGKTSVRTADKILWDCADISFGDPVTLSAKWMVLVKRAAGALAGTDQLIGYVDLNTANGTAVATSTNAIFQVNTTNGLFDL